MATRYKVSLSSHAETKYRELYSTRKKSHHYAAIRKIIQETILQQPKSERYRLAGKLADTYRIKLEGVVVDYVVVGLSKIKVVCICIADVGTDPVQMLNTLVQSGNHDKIMRDLGIPEAVINFCRASPPQRPQ